jgi:hypothetical protein
MEGVMGNVSLLGANWITPLDDPVPVDVEYWKDVLAALARLYEDYSRPSGNRREHLEMIELRVTELMHAYGKWLD